MGLADLPETLGILDSDAGEVPVMGAPFARSLPVTLDHEVPMGAAHPQQRRVAWQVGPK